MNTELGLRERKKQQTRAAIRDAAMRLFLERGFEQVSVAEVARAADVSEATVFNYFPTKEDLVYERMDAFEHELLAAVRERPGGRNATCARSPTSSSTAPTRAATGDGRRRVAELTRLTTASPSLKARERQIVANYTDALAALLAEETGAAPDDIEPRLAAEAMMAFHRSLIDFARRRALVTQERRRLRRRDPRSRRTRADSPRGRPRRLRQDTLKSGVQRNGNA